MILRIQLLFINLFLFVSIKFSVIIAGLSFLRRLGVVVGGQGFPLATMNVAPGPFHTKVEPKEIPSCLIRHLVLVFTWQLIILPTFPTL